MRKWQVSVGSMTSKLPLLLFSKSFKMINLIAQVGWGKSKIYRWPWNLGCWKGLFFVCPFLYLQTRQPMPSNELFRRELALPPGLVGSLMKLKDYVGKTTIVRLCPWFIHWYCLREAFCLPPSNWCPLTSLRLFLWCERGIDGASPTSGGCCLLRLSSIRH